MDFLNPAGLYALTLLPLLLIPYLVRRRRRIVFSSLLLLREFSVGPSSRSWARLRLPLLFFLQLIFLTLLVLGLGDPVLTLGSPEKVAVILDNSASMQTVEGKKSRFEVAKEQAQELLGSLTPDARVNLFLTVPGLDPIGTNLDPEKALGLMEPLNPYDLGEPRGEYEQFLSRLYKESDYDRIVFFTDYRVREPVGPMEVISVGEPQGNVAITSFAVTRSFASDRLQATVEVTSFDSKGRKVKLSLKGDGKTLSSKTATVAPRKTATVYFEGFPYRSYYEARLQIRDALSLDNVRYAVLPASKGLSVLGVSPKRKALRSLRGIPGLRVTVISPDAYRGNGGEGKRLEIFHYSAPQVLPENDALFVLPPKGNPLVSLRGPLSAPTITDWRDPHPLTRYVNFALFRPSYARPVVPPLLAKKIIGSPEGPLAVVVRRQGSRYLVLGFDPFPYLAQANLPMSIFTLNLLSWFFEGSGDSITATGEPLGLGSNEGGTLVGPRGQRLSIGEGTDVFSLTFFQGIYRMEQEGTEKVRAVNFDDVSESDLSHVTPLNLKRVLGDPTIRPTSLSLWPYLVLVAILLLFLEWFLNPTVTQSRFSMAQNLKERRP